MTNREKFIEAFGDNPQRHHITKSWWDEEYVPPQESKWIPISERLPEKNMSCLVSVGKLCLTQIAIYSDLMGTINHKIFYQGDYGYGDFKDITEYVKAWMPLPEPYKVESEEKYDTGI